MISHSHKFIFIPTGRSAGTTILNALRPFASNESDIQKFNHGTLSDGMCNGVDVGHWATDAQNYADYKVCSIARNPWDKMVSAYRVYPELLGIEWRPSERGNRKFMVPVNPDEKMSFREFVNEIPSLRNNKNAWMHAGCSVTSRLTDANGRFVADSVMRYEDLRATFGQFLGLCVIWKVLPIIERPPAEPHYTEYYDDKTKRLVSIMFRDDIERFGYTFGE